jgi:hypothetical protein
MVLVYSVLGTIALAYTNPPQPQPSGRTMRGRRRDVRPLGLRTMGAQPRP